MGFCDPSLSAACFKKKILGALTAVRPAESISTTTNAGNPDADYCLAARQLRHSGELVATDGGLNALSTRNVIQV